MPTTRTICTECKSVVTLPEPAEVGDVVPCPKCEAYFTVPRTKQVAPGGAKPAAAPPAKPKPKVVVEEEDDDLPPPPRKKPVVVVEDDDEEEEEEEEEEKPKKKKKGSSSGGPKKKKRRRKEEEKKNPAVLIIRIVVLAVLLGVLGYVIYLYATQDRTPKTVIERVTIDEDYNKPLTQAEKDEAMKKVKKKN